MEALRADLEITGHPRRGTNSPATLHREAHPGEARVPRADPEITGHPQAHLRTQGRIGHPHGQGPERQTLTYKID